MWRGGSTGTLKNQELFWLEVRLEPCDGRLSRRVQRGGERSNPHSCGEVAQPDPIYRKAISFNPQNYQTHTNLAIALKKQQKFDETIIHNQRAIALKPNYALAWNNLGQIFKSKGNITAANRCYQRALQLQPNYDDVYNNLGNLAKEQDDLLAAKNLYEKAIELNPQNINAHFGRALILLKQGEFLPEFSEYEWRWQHKNSIAYS